MSSLAEINMEIDHLGWGCSSWCDASTNLYIIVDITSKYLKYSKQRLPSAVAKIKETVSGSKKLFKSLEGPA